MNQVLSHNIVVIDDNELVLLQMRRLLGRTQGRNVLTFQDPHEALQHCATAAPDLVLTDYQMPGLDGVEFIRRAREMHPRGGTEYMLMTGSMVSELDGLAADAGATEVIRLPTASTAIVDRVEARLAHLAGHWDDLAAMRPGLAHRSPPACVTPQQLQSLRCLERLAAYRDNETGHHTVRMSHYAAVLAQACGQSRDFQGLMLLAAPLHDIGKIGVAESILFKPTPLTDAEWQQMKQHPIVGYEILHEQDGEVFAMGADVALHHHERWDGKGYPFGMKGSQIPLSARIVAVADVFDALTSRRRYKAEWPLDEVLAHLSREAGSHFDPDVVAALERSLTELLRIKLYFDRAPVRALAHAA